MANIKEAVRDEQSYQELVCLEQRLPGMTYTYEKSSLMEVNCGFPRIGGLSLIDWLNSYSGGGRILEIGGGKEQATAREILRKYPEVLLSALEPRHLSDSAKQELTEAPNYQLVDQGISQIDRALAGQRFNIIFAHHVLEHLPNPLIVMAEACRLLDKEGTFFCNSIPMSMEVPQNIASVLRKRGALVEHDGTMFKTENSLLRAGIIRAGFAIRVVEEFTFPVIREGGYLTDCEGNRLSVRHCYVEEN